MPRSADFLALTLLFVIGAIVFYVHFRFAGRADGSSASEADEMFYRQRQWDPTGMRFPFPGASIQYPPFSGGDGYLPPEVDRFLYRGGDGLAVKDDAFGLESALHPGPKGHLDKETLRLRWIVTLFVVLLGLLALFSLF
jgi:hypothetical protein